MNSRVVKQKTCRVKFVGDDNVKNIVSLNERKFGLKKGTIIYDFIKADAIPQDIVEESYKPSSVLHEQEDHENNISTPKSTRKNLKGNKEISSSKVFTPNKHLKTTSPKGTLNKMQFKRFSPRRTPKKNLLENSSPKVTPSRKKKSSTSKLSKVSSSDGEKEKGYSLRTKFKQISLNDDTADDSDPENSDDEDNDASWNDDSDSDNDFVETPSKLKKEKNVNHFADNYFTAQKQSKSVTSNRTMSKINIPQTNIEEIQKIFVNSQEYHAVEKTNLHKHYASLYKKWNFLLSEGFSILLYGVGSKLGVIQNFCAKNLENAAYIVVNGFYPSLTMKQILNSITEDILNKYETFPSLFEHADSIKQYANMNKEDLYIVIHNIDGPSLRAMKTQSLLSYLATSPYIHFIASVDHINCSLIWDQVMLSHFKWVWHDVTTYEPYILETSYENTLLRHQSNHLLLSSLLHVFQSLTPNGRGVFLVLAKHQMEKKNIPGFSGLTFQDWYQECREAFLVNSELTMNAQLSEFKNHKLLSSRKSIDGTECWYIPVDDNTLTQFLEKEDGE